jgi:hypothetical protein
MQSAVPVLALTLLQIEAVVLALFGTFRILLGDTGYDCCSSVCSRSPIGEQPWRFKISGNPK